MILANFQVIWGLCLVTPDLELSASREFTYLGRLTEDNIILNFVFVILDRNFSGANGLVTLRV